MDDQILLLFFFFVCLFNDTWSSARIFGVMYDHTISKLANHQIKCAVNLLIAYGDFNLPNGLYGYAWLNIPTLSPPREDDQ